MSTDDAPIEVIKRLSFRAARAKYHLSYEKWKAIKVGTQTNWRPYRGGGITQEHVQEILDSVRTYPAWNTHTRAIKLGRRTESVSQVLIGKGLSRLVARLKYAGFACDVIQPLARARQHRVLAGGPGVYTNIDFKRLGAIRRLDRGDRQAQSCFISSLQCVDAYSGFASVYVCTEQTDDAAVNGFQHYVESTPFKVAGLVLSDNGLSFTSDRFMGYLKLMHFTQRTTQFNHPWSNGKVESFNRTLKYQAMPALVAAGIKSPEESQLWLDQWVGFYNTKRIHQGWINRGLPPATVVDLWKQTAGDVFAKLVVLGHIKPEEVRRTRVMGSGRHAVDLGIVHGDAKGAPFAFIIESPPPRPVLPPKEGWTLPA